MKLKTLILAGAAAAVFALAGSPAMAGCSHRSECGSKSAENHTWRTKRVVVRRAHTSRYYEPARYKTVKKRIMIRPARTLVRVKPAVYAWKKKRVLVRHSRNHCSTYKRRHRSSCHSRRSVRPGTYAWRKVRVMVKAPKAYTIRKPAEYIKQTYNVKVSEGRYHRIKVPATYAWRKVQDRHGKYTRRHGSRH